LTLVPGGWPFLSSRGQVDCGLLLPGERTPSNTLPIGTSDVAIHVSKLLRGGWRRLPGSCFANPRLAISAHLPPVGDALLPKFNWLGRVIVVRSPVLRIRPESLRCCFHPRFPFAYRSLRTSVSSGQVVGVRHLEVGFRAGYGATLDARVWGQSPSVDGRRARTYRR
jgi:hypothetical protein